MPCYRAPAALAGVMPPWPRAPAGAAGRPRLGRGAMPSPGKATRPRVGPRPSRARQATPCRVVGGSRAPCWPWRGRGRARLWPRAARAGRRTPMVGVLTEPRPADWRRRHTARQATEPWPRPPAEGGSGLRPGRPRRRTGTSRQTAGRPGCAEPSIAMDDHS